MTPASADRACYCRPGDSTCGVCERCGAPGHTRHFPGPVPYTGAWCDRCYRVVEVRYRLLRWAVPLVIFGGAIVAARACAG